MAEFRSSERGFVLIAAIWLLILCGAIAALLLLRSIGSATGAAAEAEEFQTDLALEGAIETVAADLLFNGRRSRWAERSRDVVQVAGREIHVTLSSEATKVDLNEAALELIDRTLANVGWDGTARTRFVQQLRRRRQQRRRLASIVELAPFGSFEKSACLGEHFTLSSAWTEPAPTGIRPGQADHHAWSEAGVGPLTVAGGTPLSLTAHAISGAVVRQVIRAGGSLEGPILVSAHESVAGCSAAR